MNDIQLINEALTSCLEVVAISCVLLLACAIWYWWRLK